MSWTQDSLFADTAGPVRPTDPDTSAEAAAKPGRSELRIRVLRALVTYGEMCDEKITDLLGERARQGSVQKRRCELVTSGLAEKATDREGKTMYDRTRLGSRTIKWRATRAGAEALFDG